MMSLEYWETKIHRRVYGRSNRTTTQRMRTGVLSVPVNNNPRSCCAFLLSGQRNTSRTFESCRLVTTHFRAECSKLPTTTELPAHSDKPRNVKSCHMRNHPSIVTNKEVIWMKLRQKYWRIFIVALPLLANAALNTAKTWIERQNQEERNPWQRW